MIIIAAIIGFFVWLELIRLNAHFQREWNSDLPELQSSPTQDQTYERGRRVIEALTVVGVGICFVSLGMIVALLALLPIFMAAAAMDALWIRWCLRNPAPAPLPKRSRRKVAQPARTTA